MAFCLNRVQLLGRVGKDPKVSQTKGGEVAHFSLATSEGWTDKRSGEKKEKTEWHEIVVWAPGLVKVIKAQVKKGSRIFVEGQLTTRTWTDKEGRERQRVEVSVQQFSGQIFLMGNERAASEPQAEGDPGSWGATTDFSAPSGFGLTTIDGGVIPATKSDVPF